MNKNAPTHEALSAITAGGECLLTAPPALLEFLPLGCYACDASGRVLWFNRRAADFWGREPRIGDDSEKYCGSYKLFSLDGSIIRREDTPMANVLRTGEPVSGGTASVERPDGSVMVAMVHIAPIRDSNGNVIGAINCFHDITAAKESERRYRISEQYFRDLLNALPAAIYTTDAKGRVTFYNEAAVALAGRRPQLGTDQWCVSWELYTPEGQRLPHDQCPMAVALAEDREVRGAEAVLKRPDGTLVPFLPYPTPLHDASGQLVGAVNVLVDISDLKQHELTQRLLFSELNHRVKNNLQMLQALFRSAVRETNSLEAAAVLKAAAQKVAAISAAQRVLYHADLASAVEAPAFLQSVCECLQEALGTDVSLESTAKSFKLANDVTIPLALIINELVTNASKHAADETGRAHIRVHLSADEHQAQLSVSDAGPGISNELLTKRASGLGLVRGLVAQLGGSITLESGPGANWLMNFPRSDHARDAAPANANA